MKFPRYLPNHVLEVSHMGKFKQRLGDLTACTECGTASQEHLAFGLCTKCYKRQYMREYTAREPRSEWWLSRVTGVRANRRDLVTILNAFD